MKTFGSELDLKDVSPEVFPHQALVESKTTCNGILLSEDFVLTPAQCVNGNKTAAVYLGFSRYPYYSSNQKEPNTQIRESSNIFIHEDFAQLKGKHYLNNIAIIKLAQPATLGNKVKPARLLSRQNAHLNDGRFVNITGWIVSEDTHLKLATARLRNEDTCGLVYGSQYLRSQELCVRWSTTDHLNLVGNSVVLKDEVIGFQITSPPCLVKTLNHTSNDMILILTPFLEWIADTTGISEAELTGLIKRENIYEQNSVKIVELAAKLDTLTTDVQNIKDDLNKFTLTLDEQLSDVRSQVNNSRLDLEEEINSARTELTNGLSAQKGLNELVAQLNSSKNDIKVKMDDGLNKLKERVKDLEDRIKIIALDNDSRFGIHQEHITNLSFAISNIENKEHLALEDTRPISDSLVELQNRQLLYSVKLESIKEKNSKFIDILEECFIKIEHILDDFEELAQRNIDSDHIYLANIKEELDSQRHIMDTHIADKKKDINDLEEKIRSIIASINPSVQPRAPIIDDSPIVYDGPYGK